MSIQLTRRGFGLLGLSVPFLTLPGAGRAETRGYVNPGLLAAPQELVDRGDLVLVDVLGAERR